MKKRFPLEKNGNFPLVHTHVCLNIQQGTRSNGMYSSPNWQTFLRAQWYACKQGGKSCRLGVASEKELSDVQSKDAASILQNFGVSYENVSRTMNAYRQLMGWFWERKSPVGYVLSRTRFMTGFMTCMMIRSRSISITKKDFWASITPL